MMETLLAASNPLTHVVDHTWLNVGGFTIISNHVIMMMVAAFVVLMVIPRAVKPKTASGDIEGMTPKGFRNAIEAICQYLREFVARPNMGPHTDRFIPYIWSVFFFILTINLLGLLPLEPITKPVMKLFGADYGIYGTSTGNIWVTASLAVCTLIMIVVNGLRLHGMAYVKHFFMGPFPISVLIAFLEGIGLLAKTFALAIRLFANMMAGHILLAVLVGFISMAGAAGMVVGFGVAIPVVAGSVAINMLELFVAFLQAFIFTFLSSVFIGQAVNLHHDDEHEHDEHHAAMEDVTVSEEVAKAH